MITKSDEPVILYQIITKVDITEGVISRLERYKMKFTGKQYIGMFFTKEDHEEGFNIPPSRRIKKDEILRIAMSFGGDKPDIVRRYVYFLEGQREEAIAKVIASIDKTVSQMKYDVENLFNLWTNRDKGKTPQEKRPHDQNNVPSVSDPGGADYSCR